MSQTGQANGVAPAVRALQSLPQAIHAFAADYPAGYVIPPHHHPRAQLIHAAYGVMTVYAAEAAWLVPAGLALWMPAGVTHEVHAVTPIGMRTLYLVGPAAPWLPRQCSVVSVSPLLRELILKAVSIPRDYAVDSSDGRLMAVMLDETRDLPAAPLNLPMPRDRRLSVVTNALLQDPANDRDLDGWAKVAGASGRTLARLFVTETGLTFAAWRQRRRLMAALTRLAAGKSVTTVALDLGYNSPSAFTAMFRRVLGSSPTRYMRGRRAENR